MRSARQMRKGAFNNVEIATRVGDIARELVGGMPIVILWRAIRSARSSTRDRAFSIAGRLGDPQG
jgi:hypothetical protein